MSDAVTAVISRQSGLLREVSILANNIANAGTAGFKREASIFSEYVQSPTDDPSMSIGALRGHYAVMDEGAFRKTGGTFDFALSGDGFFAIGAGEDVLLTRNGQFVLDAQGRLVDPGGRPVLDDSGAPIEIPAEAADITVAPDGTISVNGDPLATLGIFTAPPDTLQRAGDNLWRPTQSYQFVDGAEVRQGFVEGSNVNPVLEMARLMEAQRLFEAGQALLEQQSERTRNTIETLGGR